MTAQTNKKMYPGENILAGYNTLGEITMGKLLDQFRKMEISKADLQAFFGNDLHNADCNKPQKITRFDVVNAIQAMLDGSKSVLDVVEWVNVVWFTDLFTFSDDETDSIVSVLEVLETLDEEGVVVTTDEFNNMISALNENKEYSNAG